jgi:hypothetical protein
VALARAADAARGQRRRRSRQGLTPTTTAPPRTTRRGGIAEADLPRIFQAFHQSERGGANPTEGAGLGLTIAREIAQSMGGDIGVTSRLGEGSTFVFTARLPPAPEASVPAPATPPERREAAGARDGSVGYIDAP